MKKYFTLDNILISCAFLAIIGGLGHPYIVKYCLKPTAEFSELGTVGDWFGGLSGPLIGLSSFVLVFVAFRLQNKQLKSQQDEFERQNRSNSLQRFENSFFQLLSFHNEIVQSLWTEYKYISETKVEEVPIKDGKPGEMEKRIIKTETTEQSDKREYFSTVYLMLKHNLVTLNKKSESHSKAMRESIAFKESLLLENYQTIYDKEQASLGHYFRNLYHVVKYVHISDLIETKEKYYYISILRAQLSAYELVLLTYNCLVEDLGYPKFKFLVDRYDLLQNMNKGLLLDKDDWTIFERKVCTDDPFKQKYN